MSENDKLKGWQDVIRSGAISRAPAESKVMSYELSAEFLGTVMINGPDVPPEWNVPLVRLSDAQRIRDERDRLRKALSTLLDTFERCEAGYPLDVELRFAARDMARAALALAQAEKGERE